MSILIKFIPPKGASFKDIRDFICIELESAGGNRHPDDPLFHSLSDVHVSKPITAWREPLRKNDNKQKIVKLVATTP